MNADRSLFECARQDSEEEVCDSFLCPTCRDSGMVVVAGPDSFGMYDTDDCPDCMRVGA